MTFKTITAILSSVFSPPYRFYPLARPAPQLYLLALGILSSATFLGCLQPSYGLPSPLLVKDLQDQAPTLSSDPISFTALNPTDLELKPGIIENSPVLQRWQQQVPDVMEEITNRPSFRTRLRLGYSQFPSSNHSSGLNLGIEDIFLGQTPLTLSADYATNFDGRGQQTNSNDRSNLGISLNTYLLPLGSYFNIAPVVGYRNLQTNLYQSEGLDVGVKVFLVLSRGGGADISLTQRWIAPGTDNEVGLLTLSAGYAVGHNLRLSTDIQQQNSRFRQDSRVGLVLEWML